ncbi:MAG: hypothetical protein WC665_05530 [Sulfurimonas sp.]|jgi:hypothetical protein
MKKESIFISIAVLLLTIYVVNLETTIKQELNVLKSGAMQNLASSKEPKNTQLESDIPWELEIKEGEGYAKNINK